MKKNEVVIEKIWSENAKRIIKELEKNNINHKILGHNVNGFTYSYNIIINDTIKRIDELLISLNYNTKIEFINNNKKVITI